MQFSRREISFLLCIVLVSFAVKYWFVRDYHFVFWFDQARDAIVSQDIFRLSHLKLQGPSASGTQDTLFHGVLWYYVLAPLYLLARGNPQFVVAALAFFTSLTCIPFYVFAKHFARSSVVAALACMLMVFSPDSVTNTTWIANPLLAYTFIPLFYMAIWKTFVQRKYHWLALSTFFIGILQQAVIFYGYLWAVVFVMYFFDWQKKKTNRLPIRTVIVAIVTYLAAISTMILTQIKLISHGIYPHLSSFHASPIDLTAVQATQNFFGLFMEKIKWILTPDYPVFAFLFVLTALVYCWKKLRGGQRVLLAVWICAPAALLLFHFREAIHIVLGVEWAIVLCVAFLLEDIARYMKTYLFVAGVLLLIVFGQLQSLRVLHKTEESFVGTQQGAWLDQELAVVDKTYVLAAGRPFSVSTFTNPYGYNTTWAYVYDWYGKMRYGYKPNFLGPDQKSLFGELLMERVAAPLPDHFTIIEPISGVPQPIRDGFMIDQDSRVATASSRYTFGSIILEARTKR